MIDEIRIGTNSTAPLPPFVVDELPELTAYARVRLPGSARLEIEGRKERLRLTVSYPSADHRCSMDVDLLRSSTEVRMLLRVVVDNLGMHCNLLDEMRANFAGPSFV